jgi:hypothetical protein
VRARGGRIGGARLRDLEDAAYGSDRPETPLGDPTPVAAAERAWHGGIQGAPPDTIHDDFLEDL